MMETSTARKPRCKATVAALLAFGLVLSACGGGDGEEPAASTSEDGASDTAATADSGLPHGSSMEEFQAALEGADPIELRVQLPTGPDSPNSWRAQRYAEAVDEWSGGVVTMDLLYSGAVAPILEMDDAMAEQRVDLGVHAPIYEPDAYPKSTAAIGLTFMRERTPVVGTLQGFAAMLEFSFESEIFEEIKGHGLEPFQPLEATVADAGLLCTDESITSLDDFRGKQIRVSSAGHAAQVEALGATPVSLTFEEIYEGMQRGIVDCMVSALGTAQTFGVIPIAGHWTLDETMQFTETPVANSIGQVQWDNLPLTVQQLLWDRLDVYIEANMAGTLEVYNDALTNSVDSGLEFHQFDDDVHGALQQHYDDMLQEARSNPALDDADAYVDGMLDAHEKWLAIVTEELGYSDEASWQEFSGWYGENEVDYTPFIERVMEEIYLPRRPGA